MIRTALSYILMFFSVGLGTILIPTERALNALTDTDDFVTSARHADLYSRLVTTITQRLQLEHLDKFAGTPLAVDSSELNQTLRSAFPEEWFYHNLENIHRNMTLAEEQAPPFIGVVLSDRKELMIENVTNLIRLKLHDLPECDNRAWKVLSLSRLKLTVQSQSLRRLIPSCRPSPRVEAELTSWFTSRLRRGLEFVPDSLDMATSLSGPEGSITRNFRQMNHFVSSFSFVLYLFLGVLLLILAILNYRDVRLLFFRIGLAFFLIGLFTGMLAVATNHLFDDRLADGMHADNVALQASDTTLTLSTEFGNIALHFIKSWIGQYFINLKILSLALLAVGGVLVVVPRFMHPPDVPLRGS